MRSGSAASVFLSGLQERFALEADALLTPEIEAGEPLAADRLRALLSKVLPNRLAVSSGRIVSSNTKLKATAPFDVVLYDSTVNASVYSQLIAGGFPIELVYASVLFVDVLTPDNAREALKQIADLRLMARRGKYYSAYVPIEKPNGKKIVSLRELRLDSEPRTYLVCGDVSGGEGKAAAAKWEKLDGMAKQLKDIVGEEESARLHGLLVLSRNWFLYQPTYKKRVEYSNDNALLRFCHKITIDLHNYEMHPISLDRYFKTVS